MERKRRISAPFLRTGLNNYRQSKTAAQPENTIIALIQAGIADNIFSPITLGFAYLGRQYHCMIMLSPCCIILIQVRIDPIFVGSNGLLAVIAYDNGRYTAKVVQCMVVDLNPLGFTGGDHPFCIDILRIGQNCYKHNNGCDLASKFCRLSG